VSGWDRRSFLTAGVLGTAGLAVENKRRLLASHKKPWNAKTARSLQKFRDAVPTVCRMCPAHCGIVAFRDGDRVTQILGNIGAPTNRGGLCGRAFAGLERVYDAERRLRPLRRKGPRGSGAWQTVTWAEALAEIAGHLWMPGARSTLHVGQEDVLVEELRATFGWQEVLVDRPLPGRPGPSSGERWYGTPVLGPNLSRTRTLFLFGARSLDGRISVPLARDLVEAKSKGASIHLFDSLEGATGSLTEWHPIPPRTAAGIAWGIAGLLLRWGAYDRKTLAAGVADTPQQLLTALEPFTPEAVEQSTGIPSRQLVTLARRFASGKPSLALSPLDAPAASAAALLNYLVGSVNARGGMATARGPYFVKPLRPTTTPEAWLNALVGGEATVDCYWVTDANPVYDAPHSAAVTQALLDPDRVGFIVAMDTHLHETAALADLFLPLAPHFEAWGLLEGCLPDGRPYLFLQQPVTRPASEPEKLKDPQAEHLSLFTAWPKPIGQARSLPDVLLTLARETNLEVVPFPDTQAYLGDLLRKSWGPGSFEALAARGIWVSEESRSPNPSTKPALLETIPTDLRPDRPGSLHLVGYIPAGLPRSFSNSRWGREIHHRSEALVHPDTARRLGIRNGETVHLRTPAGDARVSIRLIEGIHPDLVALPDGFGHRAGGSVAIAAAKAPPAGHNGSWLEGKGLLGNPVELSGQMVEPGETIWWAHAGPGVSLRGLYPFRLDASGLQDWGPIPVEVRRV
jgi:anaerobic selenocysteine-containing dehydrogenase